MNGALKGWVEDNLLEGLFTEMGMVKGTEKNIVSHYYPQALETRFYQDPVRILYICLIGAVALKNAAMPILGQAGRERVE